MAFDPAVCNNYAGALLAAARRLGRVAEVAEAAGELADYLELEVDRRLRVFIESPQVSREEKHALIRSMFAERVDPLLVDLMRLMIDKRRSGYLAAALRRFCHLADAEQNVFPGTVSTASELSEEDRQRIRSRLEQFTDCSLRLRFRVDPDLIGGVVFKYCDRLIDTSLRDGLNELRERLDAVRLRLPAPDLSL